MRQSMLHAIQMIKNFRFGSIFFKYLRGLLPGIMIPFLLICILVYGTYGRSSVQSNYTYMQQAHQQSCQVVNTLLENIQNKYMELCSSNDFQTFMTLKNNMLSAITTDNSVRVITDMTSQMLNNTDLMDSIDIYSSYNDYVLSNRYSGTLHTVSPRWLTAYWEAGSETFTAVTENNEGRFLTISFGVSYSKTSYGMIAFNINLPKLEELLRSSQDEPAFYVALTDAENRLIYSDNSEYAADYLSDSANYSANSDSCIATPLFLPNLTFYSLMNPAIISHAKIVMYALLALLILVSILLSFALALFLALNSYMFISKITYQLQQNTGVPADLSEDSDETMYIIRNLQNIIKDKEQFEHSLVEKIALLKKSQTLALQSQISPHFLFNTLNIINMEMSNTLGHNSQLVEMVSLLSDILSYALNSNEYFARFRDEVDAAYKYIEIEKLKYYDGFDVEWHVAEDIHPDCKVAKFMLQPIIENCFEHAIHLVTDRRGKIQITVFRKDDELVFTIADNGDGISAEKLAELRQNLEIMDLPDPHHIGLCNVNSRIMLLFGEKYMLDIESDNGTTVTITIPYLIPESDCKGEKSSNIVSSKT